MTWSPRQRNGFAARPRAEIVRPGEGRRAWLLFLTLARDHCRRAIEGVTVDRFEANEVIGFVRGLTTPFPVQSPACAFYVGSAARDLARGLLTATATDERPTLARLLIPSIDFLEAAIEADTRQRADLTRRITGESED